MFGVSPTEARKILERYHRACNTPADMLPAVGDRIAFIQRPSWPWATVTAHTARGYTWKLDQPHSLGPRHGVIDAGEEYALDGWVLIEPSAVTPGGVPAGKEALDCLVQELPEGANVRDWVRITWWSDELARKLPQHAYIRADLLDEEHVLTNHGQSLQRMCERGGMTPNEALAALRRQPFMPTMNEAGAMDAIVTHLRARVPA
jgi:hypothetical protein